MGHTISVINCPVLGRELKFAIEKNEAAVTGGDAIVCKSAPLTPFPTPIGITVICLQ